MWVKIDSVLGEGGWISQAGSHGTKPGEIPLEASGFLITRKFCLEKSEKTGINHSIMKRLETNGLRKWRNWGHKGD